MVARKQLRPILKPPNVTASPHVVKPSLYKNTLLTCWYRVVTQTIHASAVLPNAKPVCRAGLARPMSCDRKISGEGINGDCQFCKSYFAGKLCRSSRLRRQACKPLTRPPPGLSVSRGLGSSQHKKQSWAKTPMASRRSGRRVTWWPGQPC